MVRLFALMLLCCSLSWGSAQDRLEKISRTSESLNRVRLIELAWDQTASYLKKSEAQNQFIDWNTFFHLPASEREKLRKSTPKIHALCDLLDVEKIISQLSSDKAVLKDEARRLRTETRELRELLLAYHQSDLFVDDNFFDEALGIDYDAAEKSIRSDFYDRFIYAGLPKEHTQSRYEIIRQVFRLRAPLPGETFYDLGSGYGRLLLYGALLYPKSQFKGIEIVAERTRPAREISRRLGLKNFEQKIGDILSADYSDGDFYYIFNPFFSLMPKVLPQLKAISLKRKFSIVSLELTTLELKRENWLTQSGTPSFTKPVLFNTNLPVP